MNHTQSSRRQILLAHKALCSMLSVCFCGSLSNFSLWPGGGSLSKRYGVGMEVWVGIPESLWGLCSAFPVVFVCLWKSLELGCCRLTEAARPRGNAQCVDGGSVLLSDMFLCFIIDKEMTPNIQSPRASPPTCSRRRSVSGPLHLTHVYFITHRLILHLLWALSYFRMMLLSEKFSSRLKLPFLRHPALRLGQASVLDAWIQASPRGRRQRLWETKRASVGRSRLRCS